MRLRKKLTFFVIASAGKNYGTQLRWALFLGCTKHKYCCQDITNKICFPADRQLICTHHFHLVKLNINFMTVKTKNYLIKTIKQKSNFFQVRYALRLRPAQWSRELAAYEAKICGTLPPETRVTKTLRGIIPVIYYSSLTTIVFWLARPNIFC